MVYSNTTVYGGNEYDIHPVTCLFFHLFEALNDAFKMQLFFHGYIFTLYHRH